MMTNHTTKYDQSIGYIRVPKRKKEPYKWLWLVALITECLVIYGLWLNS